MARKITRKASEGSSAEGHRESPQSALDNRRKFSREISAEPSQKSLRISQEFLTKLRMRRPTA